MVLLAKIWSGNSRPCKSCQFLSRHGGGCARCRLFLADTTILNENSYSRTDIQSYLNGAQLVPRFLCFRFIMALAHVMDSSKAGLREIRQTYLHQVACQAPPPSTRRSLLLDIPAYPGAGSADLVNSWLDGHAYEILAEGVEYTGEMRECHAYSSSAISCLSQRPYHLS